MEKQFKPLPNDENYQDNSTIVYKQDMLPIEPYFVSNRITISFCTSNLYSPYCGVVIQSIIEHKSDKYNYEFLIFEYDISERNKILLLSLIENHNNVIIRFVNLKNGILKIKVNTWAHFSVVACFKLFLMSNVFSNYEKTLILDTDLIFLRDAADLFNIDLKDNYMAAVNDVIMRHHVFYEEPTGGYAPFMKFNDYIADYLGFGSDKKYYNTGVAVLAIDKCIKNNFFDKGIEKLKTKGYTYQEQDILNELCKGKITDLDLKWNVVGTENVNAYKKSLSGTLLNEYENALKKPFVIHFAGGMKPWTHNNIPYSEYFYQYAKLTPWYESILCKLCIDYSNSIYVQLINKPKYVNFFPLGSTRRTFAKKIRKVFCKFFNRKFHSSLSKYFIQSAYIKSLHSKLKKNYVLLDSKNGTDLAGNIFRIIEELQNKAYKRFKVFLTCTLDSKYRIESILDKIDKCNIELVVFRSKKYFKLLGRSKYIVSDLYMPFEYIKRKNQILISTAHGTPIKVMGRDCHTETQGHLQRMHALSDYQTFPSDYMKEKLFHGFMEDYLFTGKAMKSGYARNAIFFNKKRREELRKTFGFEDKIVFAYLPTFRGIAGSFESSQQIEDIIKICTELDSYMNDNQLLLIKLHNFNKEELDLTEFKHILNFPMNYEVYDVLNATDCLISDYSSVFFDYANTGNKIILFQYDFDRYMEQRGVYLTWKDLPFPVVNSTENLFREMCLSKNYDDKDFLKKYCTYDSETSVKSICENIFHNKNSCKNFDSKNNGKQNIFIYAGNFDLRNSSTYFVLEFFKKLDLSKNNYFLYFYEYDLFKRAYILETLPKEVQYFSFLSYPDFTFYEKVLEKAAPKMFKAGALEKMFQRECRKNFVDIPIDMFIDISGQNVYVAEISKCLKCKKVILKIEDSSIREKCFEKYDVILSYDSPVTHKQNQENLILKAGFSQEAIMENVRMLEDLINKNTDAKANTNIGGGNVNNLAFSSGIFASRNSWRNNEKAA